MGLAVLGTNALYYNMILLQLTNMKMEWGDFTKLGACEPVIYDQLLKLRSFFLLYIYIFFACCKSHCTGLVVPKEIVNNVERTNTTFVN